MSEINLLLVAGEDGLWARVALALDRARLQETATGQRWSHVIVSGIDAEKQTSREALRALLHAKLDAAVDNLREYGKDDMDWRLHYAKDST
jgi:hypothetical protein